MPKEQLVWFDFTTSLHWARPAVGIVRAEQEICRWLLTKLKDRIRLCIFDPSVGQFLELEVHEAWRVLERGWSAPEAVTEPCHPPAPIQVEAHPAGSVRRIEQVLRKLAFTALARIPRAYEPKVRSYLIAIRRSLAFGYNQLKAAHAGPMGQPATANTHTPQEIEPSRSSNRLPVLFHQGDTYVTLGLDWDYAGKMEALYREKTSKGLRVLNFAYDIIPVKFPHYFPSGKFDLFSVYFANMGWTADRIMCISQCTASDLDAYLEQVGAPRPPMTIVRLGDALPTTESHEPSAEIAAFLGTPFLLTVSTIEIRKNHESLYRAYLQLIESGHDVPTLVVVGMAGWRVDDFMYSLHNDPRVAGKIVVLNHVSDADLAFLYRNCLFTLYPSLYEGWGLPVAESLAYGKFCLASDAASIPEIAGDIIDYVQPWDVLQWAAKIQLYCGDSAALRHREKLISERYRTTSWESTAEQMIAAIESIARPKTRALRQAPAVGSGWAVGET